VRYGNVVGSRGSVGPLFQRLIAKGATELPITDPRMTRFWITLNQGVDFVLSSLSMMRGGEIFVPKIPSMKMVDLASAMAPGAAHKLVGIRPGEKLHEIMISSDDSRTTVDLGDRYAIEPVFVEYSREPFDAPGLAEGFFYASDTNEEWLSGPELLALLEEGKPDRHRRLTDA
jgi:UDP-N-acetylglucosamine 4,6-dehydratase